MKYTFVTSTRCPLMLRPTHDGEQADELLLGWRVEPLEAVSPEWVRVRTDYRYEGYAPTVCLSSDKDQSTLFGSMPKAVVIKSYSTVLSCPRVQGALVAGLTRGALVAPLSGADQNGWVRVFLPDGKVGYTKTSFLAPYYESRPWEEAPFRCAVCSTALTYLGTHYRWGGKSPLGIDCSGLAFMAYWLNGVSICRDAKISPEFPVHAIDRTAMKPGDLLFFPGHVALYLGNLRYIHSTGKSGSDGVVLNSLNPAHPDYRDDLAQKLTAVGSIF